MKVCSACRRYYEDSVTSCVEEGHPALTEARDDGPPAINGYRVQSLVESGLAGNHFLAIQTASGRSCDIRTIPPNENSDKFLSDANIATRLFHPNVADSYEAGTLDNGDLFVASENAEGRTLREFLVDLGTPDLLASIGIIRQAAEALHAMHVSGLTHGAVNPETIVLTKDRGQDLLVRIKNPDLGSVIERSIIFNKFLTDSALPYLRYFAPEQCSGDGRSAKTDVYALGIVFYEMLAGSPPFDAPKAADLMEKHRRQVPPDIRIDNFNLRMLVTHALMESLQKRPSARQSSANLLARQLRHMEQLATRIPTPPAPGVAAAVSTHNPRYIDAPVPIPSPVVLAAPFEVSIESPTAEPEARPGSVVMDAVVEAPVIARAEAANVSPAIMSEPTPAAEFLEPAVFSTETLAVESAAESFVVAEAAPHEPRISRLEGWKKKLHEITELLAGTRLEHTSIPIIETTVIESADAPKLVDLSSVEPIASIASIEKPFVEPRKIGWLQLVDDLPAAAGAQEVSSKEPLLEQAAVRAAELEETIAALEKRTSEIQLAIAEVRVRPTEDKIPAVVPQRPEGISAPIAVAYPDSEEVTVVRARSRPIRIDLEKATYMRPRPRVRKPSPRPATEPAFFPTILGAAPADEPLELDARDTMFSAYYGKSRTRLAGKGRSLTIVGGIITVMAFVLFGNDSITRYFQAWSSAVSVSRSTHDPAEAAAALVTTRVPAKTRSSRKLSPEKASSKDRDFTRSASATSPDKKLGTTKSGKPAAEPAFASGKKIVSSRPASKTQSETSTRPRVVRPARQ